MMFWALAFPMILGTLFYISFGNIGISATGDSDWDPVPVAVINKLETKSSGTFFADFLDAMNGSVLDIQDVKNEKDAKKKLENDEIFGMPGLTRNVCLMLLLPCRRMAVSSRKKVSVEKH